MALNGSLNSVTFSGGGQEQASVSNSNLMAVLNGYQLGGVRGAGAALVAVAQLALLVENLNTAQNYYDINEKDFIFFRTKYEPPLTAFLGEAMSRPLYESGTYSPQYGTLDYLASTGRGASLGPRKIDKQWYAVRRRVQRYCIGMGRWVDYKFAVQKVQETLNGWNLGFRYEDHRKEVYDEQRHAHRTTILNLGIGVGNAARAGLASSVGALSEARSSVSSNIASVGNGLATQSGYEGTQKGLRQISASGLATQTQPLQNFATPEQKSSSNDSSTWAFNLGAGKQT